MNIKINENNKLSKYKHLSMEERKIISYMFNCNYSIRKIALKLNRNPSTISRELKRNKNNENLYLASNAQHKTYLRYKYKFLSRFKRKEYLEYAKVFKFLYDKCIRGIKTTIFFLKKYYPKLKVFCFKTVYNWINSGNWVIKKEDKLHLYYVKGRKRKNTFQNSKLKNYKYHTNSWRKNLTINSRSSIGHYELDLIISSKEKNNACLLTILERYSRLGFAIKLHSRSKEQVYNALINWRRKFWNIPVYSMTVDNGKEFELMPSIEKKLKISTYYTQPYASFQKGSNENFNGIIRRKWKKETNFDDVSQEEINEYVDLINSMPREILNWKTAKEKFMQGCKMQFA